MKYYEIKSIPVKVEDIDKESRIVKGMFASYGTLDADGDIFSPGVFGKSISENGPASAKPRIKHLFNHWDAVGVPQELTETASGLVFVSKIGRHTLGNDVLMMYEDGIITEHSIGFQTLREQKETAGNLIIEAKMWEGSSLDKWGANMNTPVLKGETVEQLIARLGRMQKALRDGTYTDETFIELEIQIKQVQQHLANTTAAGQPPQPEFKGLDLDKLTKMFNK